MGDVVSVAMNNANSYVPAAGIEIIVLKNFCDIENGNGYGITTAAATAWNANYNGTSNANSAGLGTKFGITNTEYYYNAFGTTANGFSGIQIK